MTAYSTIVSDVHNALTDTTAGVGVSTSADIRQRGDVIPSVVFTVENATFTRTTTRSIAPVLVEIRIDCLHNSRLEAQALAADAETAIDASSLIAGLDSIDTDLFSRGADVEPVYLTSLTYSITCETI